MRGAQVGEQYRRLARQFQCVAPGDAERKHRDARPGRRSDDGRRVSRGRGQQIARLILAEENGVRRPSGKA